MVFRRFQGEGVEFFFNRDQIARYCGSYELKTFCMMILILVVMREKHKKMIDENELLKTKLREANGCVRNYLNYYFFNDH